MAAAAQSGSVQLELMNCSRGRSSGQVGSYVGSTGASMEFSICYLLADYGL